MEISDLEKGPLVRVKLWDDGSVSVIRLSLGNIEGVIVIVKETLLDSGEWVPFKSGYRISDVVKLVSFPYDPADWILLSPDGS